MDAWIGGSLWLVACGGAALLVRLGMGIYNTGQVRAKSAAANGLRNGADVCLAALAFWGVGRFVLGAGGGGWMEADPRAVLFFRMAAVLLGGGIVVGALAERCRFWPSLAASVVLAALVIPLAGRWAWSWWSGYRDVAGASVMQVSGAVFGLIGARMVGPRGGKYNHDGSTSPIPGHSSPMVWAGALMMLVGWIGYVVGFAGPGGAAASALNVLLAAAAGGLASLIYGQRRQRKPDVHMVHSGLLGGLAAVSAAAPLLASWQAIVVGAVAGVIVPMATQALDRRWKVDDPGGGVAIHGAGGVWGVLAAGLFAEAGTLRERWAAVCVQVVGLVVIVVLAAAAALALFGILKAAGRLELRPQEEYEGLDVVEHDTGAYPDFHQTMIK